MVTLARHKESREGIAAQGHARAKTSPCPIWGGVDSEVRQPCKVRRGRLRRSGAPIRGSIASRTASPSRYRESTVTKISAARSPDQPGRATERADGVRQHVPPRGGGRHDPEPQERERRLRQDHRADVDRGQRDHQRQQVRQQVPTHQAPVGGAGRAGGVDELALAQRERLAAHEEGGARPGDQPQHADQHPPAPAGTAPPPATAGTATAPSGTCWRATAGVVDRATVVAGRQPEQHADRQVDAPPRRVPPPARSARRRAAGRSGCGPARRRPARGPGRRGPGGRTPRAGSARSGRRRRPTPRASRRRGRGSPSVSRTLMAATASGLWRSCAKALGRWLPVSGARPWTFAVGKRTIRPAPPRRCRGTDSGRLAAGC